MHISHPKRLLVLLLGLMPILAAAHGISPEDQQRMLEAGYLHYVELGARHMLTGYDHLLFLFGVVFFLTTFRDVAKFVTVFSCWACSPCCWPRLHGAWTTPSRAA